MAAVVVESKGGVLCVHVGLCCYRTLLKGMSYAGCSAGCLYTTYVTLCCIVNFKKFSNILCFHAAAINNTSRTYGKV